MDSMSPPNPRLTSPLKVNTETSDGPSLTLPHQLTRHACILPLQAVLLMTEIRLYIILYMIYIINYV